MSAIFFEMHQKLKWLDNEGMDRVQSIIKWKWLNQGSRYIGIHHNILSTLLFKIFHSKIFWGNALDFV